MRKMFLASAALVELGGTSMSLAQSPARPGATAIAAVPDNILLTPFVGPYDGVPQWDKVTPAAFDEAFAFAIAEHQAEI